MNTVDSISARMRNELLYAEKEVYRAIDGAIDQLRRAKQELKKTGHTNSLGILQMQGIKVETSAARYMACRGAVSAISKIIEDSQC